MAKDYKPDAAMLQGLVAQGIQMKRKEPEKPVEPPVTEPEDEPPMEVQTVAETIKPAERAKRKTVSKADYETQFLDVKEFKDRKSIYISKEMHQKIAHIAGVISNRELSVGAYIENIVTHHFEIYKDDINNLYESRTIKPL